MASKKTDINMEGFSPAYEPLPEDRLKALAEEELGETEESKQKCFAELRTLIEKHNVTCVDDDDDFFLRYLRTKKFNVEKSFKAIRNYARKREALQSRLMNFTLETMKKFILGDTVYVFPYRDSKERVIVLVKPGNWDESISSEEVMVTSVVLLTSFVAEQYSSQVSGFILVIDTESLMPKHVYYIMHNALFAINLLFECVPIRFTAVHVVNVMPVAKYVFMLVKPFLPKKIKERIHLHETIDALRQHIDPEILPDSYGGNFTGLSTEPIIELGISHLLKVKNHQCHFF